MLVRLIDNTAFRFLMKRPVSFLVLSLFFLLLTALSGCQSGVLAPKGKIAADELRLAVFAIGLMLTVVIPVIGMALWFAWRYRESRRAQYTPEWKDSLLLETIWWGIPCLIIVILAVVTWKTTHLLDPYKALNPLTKNPSNKPVKVEVVSLDWKWLFIYPEYKIATLNYLRIPAGVPVDFRITAASPMNSFLVPQLGGQIYAMTGMITRLHLMADAPGLYRGLATNYTGIGFAGMHFTVESTSSENFINWVKTVKNAPKQLDSTVFWDHLVLKSTNDPVVYFGEVEKGLFDAIVMHYVLPSIAHKQAFDRL